MLMEYITPTKVKPHGIVLLAQNKKFREMSEVFSSFTFDELDKEPLLSYMNQIFVRIFMQSTKTDSFDLDGNLSAFKGLMASTFERDYRHARLVAGDDEAKFETLLKQSGYPFGGICADLDPNCTFWKMFESLDKKGCIATCIKILKEFTKAIQICITSKSTRSYGKFVLWVTYVKKYMVAHNKLDVFTGWLNGEVVLQSETIKKKSKLVQMLRKKFGIVEVQE
jgi:hypothetical protein